MVKTSVNQIPSKEVDIFTKGNYVVNRYNTIILVTSSKDTGFSGVCINSDGGRLVGEYCDWQKNSFTQFSGEITVVVG